MPNNLPDDHEFVIELRGTREQFKHYFNFNALGTQYYLGNSKRIIEIVESLHKSPYSKLQEDYTYIGNQVIRAIEAIRKDEDRINVGDSRVLENALKGNIK